MKTISLIIAVVLLILLVAPLSYHLYSTTLRSSLEEKRSSIAQNPNLTASPILGPKLILNFSTPVSEKTGIQIFGTKYLESRVYYLLNSTLYSNGTYTYLMSSSFYNISESYTSSGFGKGNTASLTAIAYNDANGENSGYNNIDFNPYAVQVVVMKVSGNLTFLNRYFSNTGFDPENYATVAFVNMTLYCYL